ncbi:hypothetical protein P7H16_19240 [Paenibacillus larvae]|nr:hypothetical protein [Paenibacillus larvae]MDT2248625.1 hypothetical protein [Paenibacillus larvae]
MEMETTETASVGPSAAAIAKQAASGIAGSSQCIYGPNTRTLRITKINDNRRMLVLLFHMDSRSTFFPSLKRSGATIRIKNISGSNWNLSKLGKRPIKMPRPTCKMGIGNKGKYLLQISEQIVARKKQKKRNHFHIVPNLSL